MKHNGYRQTDLVGDMFYVKKPCSIGNSYIRRNLGTAAYFYQQLIEVAGQQVNNGLTNSGVYVLYAVSGTKYICRNLWRSIFLNKYGMTRRTAVNNGLTNSFVYSLAVSGTNIFVGTSGGGLF